MYMPSSHWRSRSISVSFGAVGIVREGGVPLRPLRRDPQPADVQLLEALAQGLGVDPLLTQPLLLGREVVGERRRQAAGRVTGSALQRDRLGRGDRRLLERLGDRARLHRLTGEQVRGADQHPDPDPVLAGCVGGGRDHRRGPGVVNSPGEQDVAVGRSGRKLLEQHPQHRLPQHEARPRPDVAATFTTLEHEPPCALRQVQLQQSRRWHVQVGGDPLVLELLRLVRAPAGDQRERRPMPAYDRQLLGPQLRRDEAEHADAPGPAIAELTGARQQRVGFRLTHQRQRQERQGSGLRHRRRELGGVADAGHRSLHDRISGPVRPRERPVWGQRVVAAGERRGRVGDRASQPVQDPGHGLEAGPEVGRQRRVLTERRQSVGRLPPRRSRPGRPPASRRPSRRGRRHLRAR